MKLLLDIVLTNVHHKPHSSRIQIIYKKDGLEQGNQFVLQIVWRFLNLSRAARVVDQCLVDLREQKIFLCLLLDQSIEQKYLAIYNRLLPTVALNYWLFDPQQKR